MLVLVKKETGEEVKEGDTIQSFRNEDWHFIAVTRGGSRVLAKPADGSGFAQEFFPGVFPGHEIRQR